MPEKLSQNPMAKMTFSVAVIELIKTIDDPFQPIQIAEISSLLMHSTNFNISNYETMENPNKLSTIKMRNEKQQQQSEN